MEHQYSYLFIGGAPKCGTSSLYRHLSLSKVIFSATKKESFYFIDKTSPLINKKKNVYLNGIEGFSKLFEQNENTISKYYLMDGTTHLLYQKDVISQLQKLDHAKFIFILRNPARRILSSFEYTKYNLSRVSDKLSFDNYVDMLLSNNTFSLRKYIRTEQSLFVLKNDLNYSIYSNYLKLWFEKFNQCNIFCIQLEDFLEDKEKYISKIFSWLEVPKIESQLIHHNKTTGIRHKGLHYTIRKYNKVFNMIPFKKGLKDFYYKQIQQEQITREKSTDESLNALNDFFVDKNMELRKYMEIDFKKWKI